MLLRWLLAIVHLLGFAIGLGSVWARYRTLRGSPDRDGMQRAILADNWWALSAALLIGTGLLRAFVGFEKGAEPGTYRTTMFFATAGTWAMGVQFRRDSTQKLQRTNPVEQATEYNRMFGELVALEQHRRELRERATGGAV